MYGNLIAAVDILTQEEKNRYKACYCGLCRCLKEKYGQLNRLTLSYDLTFLALLLNALYEPEEISGETLCPVHPLKKCRWWKSEYTEYAADITVILAYYKCLDDWADEKNLFAAAGTKILKSDFDEARIKYPKLISTIQNDITDLHNLEEKQEALPDECAQCFGRIMGNIFSLKNDHWSRQLYEFGFYLGEFIYLVDAAVDLKTDCKRWNFNPFSKLCKEPGKEEYFLEVLEIVLGDCVVAFDKLPIIKDIGIIKNILCFGLWQNFYKQYPKKKEVSDESGPV